MTKLQKGIAIICSLVLVFLVTANVIPEKASAAAKLETTSLKLAVNKTSYIVIKNKNSKATYSFKTSDSKIATVSSIGVIKGIKVGTATITVNSTIAKKTTKVGTIKVTVTKAAKPTPTPTPLPPTPTPTPVPAEEVPLKEDGTIDYEKAKLVALTFDDGPNLTITPKVLDKLEKYEVVASFFLIGKNITDATKPVMERQLELGCEICNHSWSHSSMSTMKADVIKKEISDTSKRIDDMVGVTPKFFRPPFISTSPTMYTAIELPFINGINGSDWEANKTAQMRADAILRQVQDGNIILMHDFEGNSNTVEALDIIIPELQRRGYVFVTVSQLFEYQGVDPDKENHIWSLVK